MSDIKLFKLNQNALEELESSSYTLERELQKLMEDNMEDVLGIKFLQSEYATGKEHGGRIDSLGIDENYCPVIIEYKRSMNENVINQGLFYLDWLMDHKAAFQLLVRDKLGKEHADQIEWSIPRLLCVAGSFTKYDEHAVKQMNRNIELIRYKNYGNDILLLELVTAGSASASSKKSTRPQRTQKTTHEITHKTHADVVNQLEGDLKNLYLTVTDFIKNLGDDVQEKAVTSYIAFKRLKNFVCIKIRPTKGILFLYLNVNPQKIDLESSDLIREGSDRWHFSVGVTQVTISNPKEFEQIKHLIIKSYEAS